MIYTFRKLFLLFPANATIQVIGFATNNLDSFLISFGVHKHTDNYEKYEYSNSKIE